MVIVALFLYSVVPSAAQNLLSGRSAIATTIELERSGLAVLLGQVFTLALYGSLAVVFLLNMTRMRLRPWLWAYLLPWGAVAASTLVMEHRVSISSLPFVLLGLIISAHPNPISLLRILGILTVILAAFSLGLAAVVPDLATFTQAPGMDKGIISERLLTGPLYHPNTLGQSLALGLPTVLGIRPWRWRYASMVVVLLALLYTGSRTSIVAAVLALAFGVLWRNTRHGLKIKRELATLGALFFMLVLVFVHPVIIGGSNPASLSGRGTIWEGSLGLFAQHPILGNGADVYLNLAMFVNDVGTGAFHGHNMFVHFLTVAGLIGALALAYTYVRLLAAAWRNGRRGSLALAVWLIAFFVIGFLEVPTDLFNLGSLSWACWAPLAIALSVRNPASRLSDRQSKTA